MCKKVTTHAPWPTSAFPCLFLQHRTSDKLRQECQRSGKEEVGSASYALRVLESGVSYRSVKNRRKTKPKDLRIVISALGLRKKMKI